MDCDTDEDIARCLAREQTRKNKEKAKKEAEKAKKEAEKAKKEAEKAKKSEADEEEKMMQDLVSKYRHRVANASLL